MKKVVDLDLIKIKHRFKVLITGIGLQEVNWILIMTKVISTNKSLATFESLPFGLGYFMTKGRVHYCCTSWAAKHEEDLV